MINISFDQKSFDRMMGDMAKQVRFAASMALTNTAKDAQDEVRKQLSKRFTIRTPWVSKGVQVRAATKENLEAVVVVKDQFMVMQETGGEKTSPFGDSLGVPVGARSTPTSVTRPGSFPGAMLKRKGYFIAPISTGSHIKGVWRRTGRGLREQMKLMYIFSHQVRLNQRFKFHETVLLVAASRFSENFIQSLKSAIKK
ncbi:MAG: hypothetical protein HQM00_05665 [Magnetococcales bacterium]|nr:hypothetical protein [Magnetococcales bacterium]